MLDTLLANWNQGYEAISRFGQDSNDHAWRRQYHPELSPIGWHIGHTVFIESYWIREQVLGDASSTEHLKQDYFPWLSDKPGRGQRLPQRDELLAMNHDTHRENRALLGDLLSSGHVHPLLENCYLLLFLTQHHWQHCETLQQILQQRALQDNTQDDYVIPAPLSPCPPKQPDLSIAACKTHIGTSYNPAAYDNELLQHEIALLDYSISTTPVSNAEYMGFMLSGGYQNQELWTADGWAWKQQLNTHAPNHWRENHQGWFAINAEGANNLIASDAVYGINLFEAQAFARYAGCRLPTEQEWEHAARTQGADTLHTGQAWEWCSNTFYPYPGFQAFPYDAYSKEWFDGKHYSLRGGGLYTHDLIKRISFRNFYSADKRHIFSGLRLAK
ncbi:MAG: SUMF1/EgtB/PvdO family nonheme iron enzyme [Gammaproteobacteria bacterium]|nr:MAG: SUMF1/EgtB/PvdO family nonheme iron enzyme [Gammaproteobacteria bacterium]